jgi:hypothetical protein
MRDFTAGRLIERLWEKLRNMRQPRLRQNLYLEKWPERRKEPRELSQLAQFATFPWSTAFVEKRYTTCCLVG